MGESKTSLGFVFILGWRFLRNGFKAFMEADEIIKTAVVANFFEAEESVFQLAAGMRYAELGNKLYGCFSCFLFKISTERIFGKSGD